jgi:hypothetical protein
VPSSHIGTLGEKPLHASLKQWYALPGDQIEVPVDSFVIDLVRGDLLVEIQTGGFAPLKAKVVTLLARGHHLRIVHPIPAEKWIVKVDGGGTVISRRRSPRRGTATDIFGRLVSIPDVFEHPNFEVEVLMTVEEEHRCHQPSQAWRRRGWVVAERRLVQVVDSLSLETVHDLRVMIPNDLPDPFTTADLASGLGRPRRAAQQMAYCLRRVGVLTEVGRKGNQIEYRVV